MPDFVLESVAAKKNSGNALVKVQICVHWCFWSSKILIPAGYHPNQLFVALALILLYPFCLMNAFKSVPRFLPK